MAVTKGRQSLRGRKICKTGGPEWAQRALALTFVNLIAQGSCPWLGVGGLLGPELLQPTLHSTNSCPGNKKLHFW